MRDRMRCRAAPTYTRRALIGQKAPRMKSGRQANEERMRGERVTGFRLVRVLLRPSPARWASMGHAPRVSSVLC